MKPNAVALAKLKERRVTLMRQRLLQISALIADTERLASSLDREIAGEEQRTRMSDPTHVAYSAYATAARARRHNLLLSISALSKERDNLAADLDALRSDVAAVHEHARDTNNQDGSSHDWQSMHNRPHHDLQNLTSIS